MGTYRSNAGARLPLLSLVVVAISLGCSAAFAATGSGFSVRPGEVDPKDPATRAYFKPVLAAGASTTQHVVVTNLGATKLDLLVDPVDGLTGQTSGAVYANRQDVVAKAGAWIVPSLRTLTLAPRATVSVAFAIHVPANATAGDHLAGIAFQNAATDSTGGTFAVKEIFREVVGIQIRIPGVTSTHLSIGSLGLHALPGTSFASVVIDLTNDGLLLCRPDVTVVLRAPDGASRTVSRQLDTILPGDTIAYPMPWPDHLVAGKYVARAAATSCGPTVGKADVALSLGGSLNGSTPTTAPARAVRSRGLSPTLLLGVAGVAVLIALLIGRRRRPAHRIPADPVPPMHETAPAMARPASMDHPVDTTSEVESERATASVLAGSEANNEPTQQTLWP